MAYIKGFSDIFKDTAKLDTLQVPEVPPQSAEMVKEGRQVFATLECWSCHGTRARATENS